jgi:Tfp pilus assembly protein PilF
VAAVGFVSSMFALLVTHYSGWCKTKVYSYRGELAFTQGRMDEARMNFEKAMELDPTNPTPYVNAAMVILNSPPQQFQMPDTNLACSLLEKAISIDPQFSAAYVHLGQIRLGMATEIETAKTVIDLYEQGLANCRTAEEVKELCGMLALAKSQVAAAIQLGIEKFNMS